MGKMLSVRVSDRTQRAVARLARARGRTGSAVLREAIDEYLARHPAEVRPYDAWKDVIGMVKGLPSDLSERTGEKVRKLLLARYKATQ